MNKNIYEGMDAIHVETPSPDDQILSLSDLSKSNIERIAEGLIETVVDGRIDPLKAHTSAKAFEAILKKVFDHKDYKEAVLSEARKHGAKSFEFNNAVVEVREMGARWDYSMTEDAKLQELEAQAAEISTQIKARQAMLQTIPAAGIVDPETGAMIYPAAKTSTTGIAIKLI